MRTGINLSHDPILREKVVFMKENLRSIQASHVQALSYVTNIINLFQIYHDFISHFMKRLPQLLKNTNHKEKTQRAFELCVELLVLLIISKAVMDCYYHPKNPLLNFCTNPGCSLPLCPKCINLHLSQSSNPHQIVSINEAEESFSSQVQNVLGELNQQYKAIREEYSPNNVLKDYSNMLQKYRQQALEQINRHYDYLERQVLNEISVRFSQHLQKYVIPLEDQLKKMQKARQGIKDHRTSLETLIVNTSQESIKSAQGLLAIIKDKKKLFKGELPRLQDGEGGRLKMTSHKVEVVSQRIVSPTFNQPPAPAIATPMARIRTEVGPLAGVNRIAELQARLHSLRYD